MSCAPWLSRTRRGGCNAAAAGVVVTDVRHSEARSADKAAHRVNGGEQKQQQYQRFLSLPSAAACAGAQQQRGQVWQLKQRRAQRKPSRGVKEDSPATARRDRGHNLTGSPEADEQGEGHTGVDRLHSQEQPPRPKSEQRGTTARNADSNDDNKSSSNPGTSVSRSSRRRSSQTADSSRIQTRSSRAVTEGAEQIRSHNAIHHNSGAAVSSDLFSRTAATANPGAPTKAVIDSAQAAPAVVTGRRAVAGEAIDSSSRRQLRQPKQADTYGRPPPGELKHGPEISHEFQGNHRGSDMAESVSRPRERSLSLSPPVHGRLASPSSDLSDAASEETAALPAAAKHETVGRRRSCRRAVEGASSAPDDAGINTVAGRTHRGSETAAVARGSVSPGASAEGGEYEDGGDSHFASGRGSHYTRHSILAGRRRTGGRMSKRWSSAFIRSRRSIGADDGMPSVLPMSETDWIIVDRLSRKTNSSNFATVLKAYLIIKTRIAAQRANKEYAQNQRKGRPGTALRLLLQRQNNRVALRMRAAEAGEGAGAAAAAGPPSAADAATTAAAVSRVEAETTEMDTGRRRAGRRSSGSERSSRDSPGRDNNHTGSKGEQQDVAAALHVAASAGGGSIVGCGMMAETPDISLSSPSFGPDDSAAADNHSRAHPRHHELNRVPGLKGVGDVGRMQAHQSLLEQRLVFLGLRSVCIRGDGNCLFRSCSYNLYGSEEYHRYVRLHATQHMRSDAYRKDYAVFFEHEHEFDTYLKNMQRPGTWGDELCVRAIADSFECTIHIITSTDTNWYLRYDPQLSSTASQNGEQDDEEEDETVHAGQHSAVALPQPVKAVRHIFLTYISPIHYNAFTITEEDRLDNNSD